MTVATKPNLERELSRLKNFQRDTVEHVFSRMYDAEQPAKRFLVADEVGLGKTLVARGIVAKVIDRLWEDVGRIDVIYICSNGSIARQNINRLNVSDAKDASLPSRITLLPTVVRGLKGRKLNFISLTPQTSFDLRSSLGTYEERALLHWLLPDRWRESKTAVLNLLQGAAEREAFRGRVAAFEREHIDPELRAAFHQQLDRHPKLADEFAEVATRFHVWRQRLPEADRLAQREMVGRLRLELAVSCLGALEPDLIILDEFQRFKHLLDGSDQASALARELFTFPGARVLLLSATPYKMYTVADEVETDDHFRDFLQTISFLHLDEQRTAEFKSRLDRYRSAVFALSSGDGVELTASKDGVQDALRQVMVRTERLAVSADRNGMLSEAAIEDLYLKPADVGTFVTLANVAAALEHPDVTEYWKSAPYLLNFMDAYHLKESFSHSLATPATAAVLAKALRQSPSALLNWDDVERYRALDPANARLRSLLRDVFSSDSWKLLWLPSALPYYQEGDAFALARKSQLTKKLIFSAWQVVPKVVAALLSYEAERLMFGDRPEIERPNTADERERISQLLRFSRTEGRLTGMPVLTLLYPSITLAELGDPLEIRRSLGGMPAREAMLSAVRDRIQAVLDEALGEMVTSGPPDEAWYWAAPVFLDVQRHRDGARAWLSQSGLADIWRGADDESPGAGDPTDAWSSHVADLVRASLGQLTLGARPADLADVLAAVALGSPAVTSLRALSRIADGVESLQSPTLRTHAGAIAWGFRTLFNLPEVTVMLRRGHSASPYWRQVLDYSIEGGLQAVMDEYVHVLQEWEGVAHKPVNQAVRAVATKAAEALQLRTAAVGVDAIDVQDDAVRLSERRMRARFAARFGARQMDEGAGALRADDVRTAFNSPFWPFVLCSTSVGQEGLDFHLYCHAVVHWNLPTNPVDLEQREGRVHRYKGHAIRKNASLLYGAAGIASTAIDPWSEVFDRAMADRAEDSSDLVPFWVLPAENGARIERHIPALPLSRDVERAEALRRSLTVYRMAFGQNRQDDLVAYLTNRFSSVEIASLTELLRIDLSPARRQEEGRIASGWHREASAPDDEQEGARSVAMPTLSLQQARLLLDEFVARRATLQRAGVEHYRGLLDQWAAIRNR